MYCTRVCAHCTYSFAWVCVFVCAGTCACGLCVWVSSLLTLRNLTAALWCSGMGNVATNGNNSLIEKLKGNKVKCSSEVSLTLFLWLIIFTLSLLLSPPVFPIFLPNLRYSTVLSFCFLYLSLVSGSCFPFWGFDVSVPYAAIVCNSWLQFPSCQCTNLTSLILLRVGIKRQVFKVFSFLATMLGSI